MALAVKNPTPSAEDVGLIPGLGRSLGEGNGNPFQYSHLGNSMDRRAWWAAVYGVAQSRTRLKQLSSSNSICGIRNPLLNERAPGRRFGHWARRAKWTRRLPNYFLRSHCSRGKGRASHFQPKFGATANSGTSFGGNSKLSLMGEARNRPCLSARPVDWTWEQNSGNDNERHAETWWSPGLPRPQEGGGGKNWTNA